METKQSPSSPDSKPEWYDTLSQRLSGRLSNAAIKSMKSPTTLDVKTASQIRDALIGLAKVISDVDERNELCTALQECVLPHPSLVDGLLKAVSTSRWNMSERYFLQWKSGYAGVEYLLDTLGQIDLNARGTIRTQRYFLDVWDHPKAEGGLRDLYEKASWPEARAALRQLSGRQDRVAIPILVRLAAESDPTIQREICDALARIGDPSGEPLLMELIAHTDAGRTLGAAKALGVVGSRRSLPILNQARAEPGIRKDVKEAISDAIQAIRSREDLEETEGAVSLALDREGGLTLPDQATASQYSKVSDTVGAQDSERWVPRENRNPWAKLLPAPRHVPVMTRLHMIAEFSPTVWVGVGWLVSAFVVVALDGGFAVLEGDLPADADETMFYLETLGAGLAALGGIYVLVFMMLRLALDQLKSLGKGELVLAHIDTYEPRTEVTGKTPMTYHVYTVSYVDADGESRQSTGRYLNRWGTASSGDMVPLLIRPNSVFVSIYEYSCIDIGDGGELIYTGWKSAWLVAFIGLNVLGQIAWASAPFWS